MTEIDIYASIIDQWYDNSEKLWADFKSFTDQVLDEFNVEVSYLDASLNIAYNQWRGDCDFWKLKKFTTQPEKVSIVKVMSLLLCCLGEVNYIDKIQLKSDRLTDELSLKQLEDYQGSPTIISALDFCVGVIDRMERDRIDRSSDFSDGMTPDIRHNLITLINTNSDQFKGNEKKQAVMILLEGIYARA